VQDREFSDVKFLSTGSNAAVYAAYRRNKYVAIKMLKTQIKNREIAVQEMLFEMEVLRKIEHPNIITVYGAGETPRKFIMLEYLGGGTLESLLRSHQDQVHQRMGLQSNIVGLSWELALPIVLELASALKYLHVDFLASAVLIHRGTFIFTISLIF
jgi:serine/threonine protein kinase